MTVRVLTGDCRTVLQTLPSESVHCVVTSPPYFNLRDYGTATWEGGDAACDHRQGRNGAGRADGVVDERGQRNRDGVGSMGGDCRKCGARRLDSQIGLEPTPEAYVAEMVGVFREARRVLRDDGTLWLNLGDSYAGSWGAQGRGGPPSASSTLKGNGHVGGGPKIKSLSGVQIAAHPKRDSRTGSIPEGSGIKPKDLIGIPWRVAFALQADGWYLRQDIIWAKPNPMPESVRDRCTKAHEYVFLLSKRERYWYDPEAISESAIYADDNGKRKTAGEAFRANHASLGDGMRTRPVGRTCGTAASGMRNRRSVWTIATQPFGEAHFATMPPDLAELCIKAGCPKDGTVLDPFGGAGTTALVADRLGRNAVIIELNPDYATMARRRLEGDAGMFANVLETAE